MKDPNAGKYQKLYAKEFDMASSVLFDEGSGRLFWGEHNYEAFIYLDDDVRLIFYPHKTTAGNVHIRVRDSNSKNKKRANLLMLRLKNSTGSCVFTKAS